VSASGSFGKQPKQLSSIDVDIDEFIVRLPVLTLHGSKYQQTKSAD